MSTQRGVLPRLTEVIEVDAGGLSADSRPAALAPESMPMELLPVLPVDTGADLKARMLEALLPRIDALLEERLREVLTTRLSRLAEDTAHRVRGELAGAVQTLVAQAVEDVLARRNKP